jgi:hypothetical protein
MGRPTALSTNAERARGPGDAPARARKREHAMIMHQGPIAVARPPRKRGSFSVYCHNIGAKLKGNTALSSPPISLDVYEQDLAAYDTAETTAKDKAPAALADRDAKALKVYQNVRHIVDYVQGVADIQASPADAIAVILSAGLQVKRSSTRKKRELDAKYTGISGQVQLLALVIAGAGAYYWEFSLDMKSWSTAPETTASSTTVSGLTPGQLYYFRFRALTNKGKTDYSQVVSLIMH